MNASPETSCKGKGRCCGIVFALAHIAILTCISMALWKIAWAVESIAGQG
jgi:hypothetical protein